MSNKLERKPELYVNLILFMEAMGHSTEQPGLQKIKVTLWKREGRKVSCKEHKSVRSKPPKLELRDP